MGNLTPDIGPVLIALYWYVPVMTFFGTWKLIDISLWIIHHITITWTVTQ